MIKKILFIIGVLSLIFIMGCSQQIVCNEPYIRFGADCCLDKNNDNICDSEGSLNVNNLTNDSISKTISSSSSRDSPKSKILSYKITFKEESSPRDSKYKLIGEVQNDYKTIDYPKVYFIGYNSMNEITCTKNTFTEVRHMGSGEISPFELTFSSEDCPDLKTYKIKFKDSIEKGNSSSINKSGLKASTNPGEKDKCSSIKDWTVSDTEAQQKICYESKYLQYSVLENNVSICNEIISGAWLGTCYANFASEKEDLSICNETPNIKYTAKGFYKDISSRDVCYYTYLMSLGGRILNYEKTTIPENICDNISNKQLKEDCNTKKEALEEVNELN